MPISQRTSQLLQIVRCADVCDALDSMGLQDRYEMDLEMKPLFYGVRFAGVAHTQEFDLYDLKMPQMTYEEFDSRQYRDIEDGGFGSYRRPGVGSYAGAPGEVFVIDAHRTRAGILGSANTLNYMAAGVVGFVIDGTCRDTGECIMQKSPVFSTVRSYTHPMGRIRIKSDNEPIVCAGVCVSPGDVIIADDDGVICVPQGVADEVVRRAYLIQQKDRADRRRLYDKLGREFDQTVELLPDLE